jgi:hypothetical protein
MMILMLFKNALPAAEFTKHRVKTKMLMDGGKVIFIRRQSWPA